MSSYFNNLNKGILIEQREHGFPKNMAKKIAMDHLRKNPGYYSEIKVKYSVNKIGNNIVNGLAG